MAEATEPRTAPRGESEPKARARHDRIAAQKRVGAKRVEGRATARGANIRSDGQPEALHRANPDRPGDSSVRHAEPTTGKRSGEGAGGYPAGEYDVTKPAPNAAKVSRDDRTALVEAHLEGQDSDELKKLLGDNVRLDSEERDTVLEAMPIGWVLEHEGLHRWRCRSAPGQGIRWGHGKTWVEAVESYILGEGVQSVEEAAAREFAKLPASQQAEIRERDEKAAARVGGTASENFAREEARKAAAADKGAALPAANAVTDGAEKASARDEAGRKAGASKRPASKRSGAKKSGRKR